MDKTEQRTNPRKKRQTVGMRKSRPDSFFVLMHVKSPAALALIDRCPHLRGKPVDVLQILPIPTDHMVVELIDKKELTQNNR